MITRESATQKRDLGMAMATDKADRDQSGWSALAGNCLVRFCKAHGHGFRFLTEDVRLYCETLKLIDAPENKRAWGSVMRNAARDGFVRKVGYKPALSSNLSPKVEWEVV